MATLELKGIKKDYAAIHAVRGVDLRVGDGEFLAILGPSGCGKSTTMRMIAGLEFPSVGDILIGDKVVTTVPPRARNVAMVFQNYALYPSMTVTKNIAFPLRIRGLSRRERLEKVRWAAGIMGISHLLDRMPVRLSGGERQRVALARALVHDPELFIFDEPLSALDAQVRAKARTDLRELHDSTGVTTVYVTHDQTEALSMGDRVAVMQDGRILQVGTPKALYDFPVNTFVAGFLGSPPMNMLAYQGKIVGFRAEHSRLEAESAAKDSTCFNLSVHIRRLEFLGAMWFAHVETVDDDHTKIIVRVTPDEVHELAAGERRNLVVADRWLRWFDAKTGQQHADTRQ